MVAPLYTDVSAGIRAVLDDQFVPGGSTYTDAFCQKYVEMAQQTLVQILISNSVERAKMRTETPITVPAGTTILDYAVLSGGTVGAGIANILPDDLVVPDYLWEAIIGGQNTDFVSMQGPGEIPRITQLDTLRYWNWYGGQVHLLGATQDRLVRMDYWSFLPAVNPAGRMKIVCSGNAIIELAASLCARAKGQYELADRCATFNNDGTVGGKAGFEILQIISAEVKAGQQDAVRRRPYFGRDRYSNQDYWIRGRY